MKVESKDDIHSYEKMMMMFFSREEEIGDETNQLMSLMNSCEDYFAQIYGSIEPEVEPERFEADDEPVLSSLPPVLTSPGKEGALIIMNPFTTNGRTAITTFILVPNDSTRRTIRRG